MPEPVRIALRLLGLVLLVVGAACLVAMLWSGPSWVADSIGVSCGDDSLDPAHQCTAFDAISVLWSGVWISLGAGFALRLITRTRGKGPLTIDFSRLRRS